MTAVAREVHVGSQVQIELLPARIASEETVEQRPIAGLRQPSVIGVDEAVAIVPEEVQARAGRDLRVEWKAVGFAVLDVRGLGPRGFFSVAGADIGVVVEIQARARVERRAQPVVGGVMEPEEIEIGHDAHAWCRHSCRARTSRATSIGTDRPRRGANDSLRANIVNRLVSEVCFLVENVRLATIEEMRVVDGIASIEGDVPGRSQQHTGSTASRRSPAQRRSSACDSPRVQPARPLLCGEACATGRRRPWSPRAAPAQLPGSDHRWRPAIVRRLPPSP